MADSQYHKAHWNARFGAMGDEAESVFEAEWPKGWVRYGLRRPPIQVSALPLHIRYTPDYLTSTGLVEVQGFGQDGLFRLKAEKYQALAYWATSWTVDFFLWNSSKKQWGILPFEDVALALPAAEMGVYAEGKPYWMISAAQLPIQWTSHTPEAAV